MQYLVLEGDPSFMSQYRNTISADLMRLKKACSHAFLAAELALRATRSVRFRLRNRVEG